MSFAATAMHTGVALGGRHSVPLQTARADAITGGRPICSSPQLQRRQRRCHGVVKAERSGDSSFATGFIVGGAIFGALGFLLAPQISAALLGEDQKLKLPRFLDGEDKDPEATKQDLADKIAQLNSAIDDVSSQLRAQDRDQEQVEAKAPAV